jgi:hypothetical protein
MQKLPILKGTMTLLYTLVVSASHSARQPQYKLYHPRPKYKAQDLKTGFAGAGTWHAYDLVPV